jgi:hypothetical protein
VICRQPQTVASSFPWSLVFHAIDQSFLLLRKTKLLRERDRLLLRKTTRRSTSAIRGMEDGEKRMYAPTRVFSTIVVAMNPSRDTHTLSLSLSLSVATFRRTFPVANRRRPGSSLLCLRVVA